MMLESDARGLVADLNTAARCATSDWEGVRHSANPVSDGATILGPQRRNRRWDPREKARITAESFEPGANISAVARLHGVSPGLLHYWRRTVRERSAIDAISFVPLTVEDSATSAKSELEIEFGEARIFVRGAVDASVLLTVCDVLRSR